MNISPLNVTNTEYLSVIQSEVRRPPADWVTEGSWNCLTSIAFYSEEEGRARALPSPTRDHHGTARLRPSLNTQNCLNFYQICHQHLMFVFLNQLYNNQFMRQNHWKISHWHPPLHYIFSVVLPSTISLTSHLYCGIFYWKQTMIKNQVCIKNEEISKACRSVSK